MKRMTLILVALVATGCASTKDSQEMPPIVVEVDKPPVETRRNIDTGHFGITEPVAAQGALLELPQSFDIQLLDTTSAIRVNDRWMPEVQVLMASDELLDMTVKVSVRPIDATSGDALVSNDLEARAERTTHGNQTRFHVHHPEVPGWRTVVFVPVEDTMWVVDFIGNDLEEKLFDDFVVATLEEASFVRYPQDEMLAQARKRANGQNINARTLPEG